jgi:uncharacterized protein (DUF302 family)
MGLEVVMNVPAESPTPDGVVTRQSRWSVTETIARLTAALEGAGAKLFATFDHSGEAQRAGLSLRDTKVLVFGNPAAGTALMEENALLALDLPLKVLIWQSGENDVRIAYLAGAWLAERYGIVDTDRAKVLAAVDRLVAGVITT